MRIRSIRYYSPTNHTHASCVVFLVQRRTIEERTIFGANELDFQIRLVMEDQFAETVEIVIGPLNVFWWGRAYG